MILFAVAPKRIGQLDFLIPFVLNFIHDNNKYTPIILFFDKKLFLQFKKNIVLREIIKKNGYYFFFNIPKFSLINILFRILIVFPFLIFFLIKKNNIIFIYKSIDTIIDRMLYFFNKFRGKTYTYFANNTYDNLVNRYFKKDGTPLNRTGDKVTIINNPNPGDGLLINSMKSKKFHDLKGFKKYKVVGFPFLNKPFQDFIKDNSFKIINNELEANITNMNNINTILINKFWGRWSNQNITWLKSNLSLIIDTLNKKYPESIILIRPYPVENSYLTDLMKEKNYTNVYFTHMHPSSLSFMSKNVIGIAQSSACLSCLAFETPYIEISNMSEEQDRLYTQGSIYSEYCTVIKKAEDLGDLLVNEKIYKINKDTFIKKVGHEFVNLNNKLLNNN
ncbi:hypothetical protein OAT04_04815 [Candidatus Pelagibacter sp.]|jgi:hypothetical protein|nr:hypothetical protein [Candidatus Pelagibacter sp.]